MLYTFVLDLKLTPDNRVKILEIQQPLQSGALGYYQAYNKNIVKDDIMPFYSKTFNIPVFNADPRSSNANSNPMLTPPDVGRHCYEDASALPVKKDFSPDKISTYSAIVCPKYGSHFYSCHIECEQKPNIKVINDHPLFNSITWNKFLQNQILTPLIEDITPQEVAVDKKDPKKMAEEILKAISSDKIVLKIPDAARAEGVAVVKRKDLLKTLTYLYADTPQGTSSRKAKRVLPHKRNRKNRGSGKSISSLFNHRSHYSGEWMNQPVIVAQSYEASKSVKHPEDGKDYDPTMRVFLSVWSDDNGLTQCSIHGGYWKFPTAPVKKWLESGKSLISACPIEKPGGQVSKEDLECIENALKKNLAPALEKLHTQTVATICRDYIASPHIDKGRRIISLIRMTQKTEPFKNMADSEVKNLAICVSQYSIKMRSGGFETLKKDPIFFGFYKGKDSQILKFLQYYKQYINAYEAKHAPKSGIKRA